MRAELLEIYGFDFIDIQEFYSELKPNKHGRATIGGTISGAKKEEYLSSGGKLTQIIAKTYEGNSIVLFCGIITSCNIKSNGDVHYMTLKVSIDDDENNSDDKAFLNYATVYSSPEGGSWYCMPEVGDRVIVKFPDANEQNVYVQNAFHVGSAGGRDNPEIKFFKNKEGKEIRLSPESVLITDNNGSSIELKDDKGISIKSSGMISIVAKTEVFIESSNAGISLISPTSVQITQNGTQIEMNDGIANKGSKVYLG